MSLQFDSKITTKECILTIRSEGLRIVFLPSFSRTSVILE